MNTLRYDSLEDALASMPRDVQPERDLWPGIASAIDTAHPPQTRAPQRQWPLALAASVALVGLVAALCWSVVQQRTAPELSAQRAPESAARNTFASFEPQNAAYVAARAALERTFDERLNLLAPSTRSRVLEDLTTIRKANADIRAALAQDPASPLLLQLMRSAGQQEIDLYRTVAQTTEPMLPRST